MASTCSSNPFASRPLFAAPWRRAGVGVHQLVGPDLRADSDVPDGTLVMRRCVRFVDPGTASYAAGTPNASDYVPHELARPRDGEWFGGPGVLGMSDSVFLMLHDGWTICVGRDRHDNDWQYIVKWGEFRSLQAFIDAGDPGPPKGRHRRLVRVARCRTQQCSRADRFETLEKVAQHFEEEEALSDQRLTLALPRARNRYPEATLRVG